jgi:hypothetical protein
MIIEQLLALIEDLTFAPLSKTAFANIKSQTDDSNSSNTMQLFLKYNELKLQYLIQFYGCRVGVIKLEGDTMHCCYHQ